MDRGRQRQSGRPALPGQQQPRVGVAARSRSRGKQPMRGESIGGIHRRTTEGLGILVVRMAHGRLESHDPSTRRVGPQPHHAACRKCGNERCGPCAGHVEGKVARRRRFRPTAIQRGFGAIGRCVPGAPALHVGGIVPAARSGEVERGATRLASGASLAVRILRVRGRDGRQQLRTPAAADGEVPAIDPLVEEGGVATRRRSQRQTEPSSVSAATERLVSRPPGRGAAAMVDGRGLE